MRIQMTGIFSTTFFGLILSVGLSVCGEATAGIQPCGEETALTDPDPAAACEADRAATRGNCDKPWWTTPSIGWDSCSVDTDDRGVEYYWFGTFVFVQPVYHYTRHKYYLPGQLPPNYKDVGEKSCSVQKAPSPFINNPIHAGTGNKFQKETDIAVGRSTLSFTRYYNSIDNRIGSLGSNWRHGFERKVILQSDGLTAWLVRADGENLVFKLVDGIWTPDGNVSATLERSADYSTWTYTSDDNTVEIYDSRRRLTSITTSSGKVTTLSYNDTTYLLETVTGPYGRTLSFAYADGRLESLTDSATGTYHYTYDANNNLEYVIYPDATPSDDTENPRRQYHYEDVTYLHALTGITDERGIRYAIYDYDPDGRGILTEHAGGVDKATLAYNTDGTTTVTDSLQRTSTYTFSIGLDVTRVDDITGPGCSSCGSGDISATYDANNNVLTKTEHGVTTAYGNYDAKGKFGYKIEAQGTTEERRSDYTYDPRFNHKVATITTTSVYGGGNKVISYGYDDFGNRTSHSVTGYAPDGTPVSRTTTYQYNGPLNQLSQIDGPRTDVQDIVTLDYYADDPVEGFNRSRIKRITSPLGIVRDNIQYSASGKVLSEDRTNGLSLSYSYYVGSDRLETITESDGTTSRTTRWTYLATGEVETVTTAYGTSDAVTLTFGYDDARRLTSITDDLGNKIEYTLDTEGNQKQVDTYDAQSTLRERLTQTFDIYNRLDLLSQANEQLDSDFAPDGTLDKVTDGKGGVTDYSYDALKRLVSTTQDLGGTDPATANALIQFEYNDNDDLTQVIDPTGGTTTYTYDDLGNLLSQISPDTGTTSYTYDAAGNVRSKTDAKNQTTSYQYDTLNRLTSVTYADTSSTTYSYDNCTNGIGHLCTLTDNSGSTSWQYNGYGEVSSRSQNILVGGTPTTLTTALQYNAAGELSGITYPSGMQVDYSYSNGKVSGISIDGNALLGAVSYQPFGPVTGWIWGNGAQSSRSYDLAGRLSSQTLGSLIRTVSYDENGNLTTITDSANSQLFGYDALNRLISGSDNTFNLAWTYDANGNRLSETDAGVQTSYTIDTASNRLLSVGGTTYQHDSNGQLIDDGVHTYQYDVRNRLVSVDNGTTGEYHYNDLGQRVYKHSASTGDERLFIYEGYRLLGEYDTSGNAVQETVWMGNLPVATIQGGTVYSIHSDHLGTPRVITDNSNTEVWRWESDPFGEAEAVGASFEYNLRFPGQYYDAETGKHYNYFRDYDPNTGRYVESDPIGLGGGLNTFAYVGGNPLTHYDPYGLVDWPGAWEHCSNECAARGQIVKRPIILDTPVVELWRCECVDGSYENPGHHDPKGGCPNRYNPTKETLPENHEELWKQSRPDPRPQEADYTRWTKEGTGKNTNWHRFSNDRNGNWHWSGSSKGGYDGFGNWRSLKPRDLPKGLNKVW